MVIGCEFLYLFSSPTSLSPTLAPIGCYCWRQCVYFSHLLQEHVYHVLENEKNQQKPRVVRSTCSNNYDTPDFIPDKLPAEEFPIYQEVSEVCVKNPRSLAVS